jgi:hypothetical protein
MIAEKANLAAVSGVVKESCDQVLVQFESSTGVSPANHAQDARDTNQTEPVPAITTLSRRFSSNNSARREEMTRWEQITLIDCLIPRPLGRRTRSTRSEPSGAGVVEGVTE